MHIPLPNHFPLEGSASGIYTQNVAREFVKKGHESLVITPAHKEQTGFPFEVGAILFSPDEVGSSKTERFPKNFPCFTINPLSTTTYADPDDAQREAYIEAFRTTIASAVNQWRPEVIRIQHL